MSNNMISFTLYAQNEARQQQIRIIRECLLNWAEHHDCDFRYVQNLVNLHVYFPDPDDFAVFRLTWPHPEHQYKVFEPNSRGTYVMRT